MKARELVSEVFDSDVKGQLVRATNDLFTTKAEIGNRTIVFNASMYEKGMDAKPIKAWEIDFTERTPGNMSFDKTGSGNELQVFSFVLESIKELVARYAPDEIVFTSHKADGNRTSLYTRMAKRIKIPGYSMAPVSDGGPADVFTIVRDK